MNYDTLICLSGGIDSTFAIWDWWQRNGHNPKARLLIHHCHMETREGRLKYESEATRKIIQYFESNGFKNFDYTESSFSYGTIKHIVQDIEIIGFLMGVMCRSREYQIASISICASKYDLTLAGYGQRSERRYNVIKALTGKIYSYSYPIINYDRKDMIEMMPRELLDLCWFCRTPDNGKPCGKCKTCKSTLPYL
jgi:hypothetical protein